MCSAIMEYLTWWGRAAMSSSICSEKREPESDNILQLSIYLQDPCNNILLLETPQNTCV